MTIDPKSAAAALHDIETVEQTVKAALFDRTASSFLILAGSLTSIGYLADFVFPALRGRLWIPLDVLTLIGVFALGLTISKTPTQRTILRPFLVANVVVFAFGLFWSLGLARMGVRELNAFWPTLYMFTYVLAGLWRGRAYVIIGLAITAATFVGYRWSGPWFGLWLAVVNGGGLILGGLWLRRA